MLSDWMNTVIFCTAMVCIAKIICVCTICGTLEKIIEKNKQPKRMIMSIKHISGKEK